jgi:hypothetical protein
MENLIRSHITQLSIISKIPKDGTLEIRDGGFVVYKNTWPEWVYRKLHGTSRIVIMKKLKDFYDDIIQVSNHMMLTNSFHIALLESLGDRLEGSIIGLGNMCKYYHDDEEFKSFTMTIVSTQIKPQLASINSYLKNGKKTKEAMGRMFSPSFKSSSGDGINIEEIELNRIGEKSDTEYEECITNN